MAVPLASKSTALAPADIHCIVRALRCADEWHTAAAPLRRHGWPAPRGCGFSGSEAHPLSALVSVRSATRATGREPPFPAARTPGRRGTTGAAAGAGIARLIEMDIPSSEPDSPLL
uniref:COR413-TM1 n=1 Tax=Arundo donax TaxID=35708 RepID=A0A0A9GK06_ARUDO